MLRTRRTTIGGGRRQIWRPTRRFVCVLGEGGRTLAGGRWSGPELEALLLRLLRRRSVHRSQIQCVVGAGHRICGMGGYSDQRRRIAAARRGEAAPQEGGGGRGLLGGEGGGGRIFALGQATGGA